MMGTGDFIGEGGMAGRKSVRIATATAVTPVTALTIENKEMFRVLHVEERVFRSLHQLYAGSVNIRIEEDLIDQLFNSSEKTAGARTLLLRPLWPGGSTWRARFPGAQEMLAEMVGTTWSRVNFFMNKFRKMGFIKYNGGLQVNASPCCFPAQLARIS